MQSPFLTIPIALPGDGDNTDKVVDCKIIPGTVLFYHEGFSWGTMIYTAAGPIMSTLTVAEYETACRSYYEQVYAEAKKAQGKNGNGIVQPFKRHN